MKSLANLGSAQVARQGSLPAQSVAPSPLRESMLEPVRQRNAVLDAFFYDVGILGVDESADLALRYAAEGAILSVGPSYSPHIDIFRDIGDFDAAVDMGHAALAVAGVGSSALGAAAFARNIADATGGPCLVVVSGYGLSDLITEAAGGWFLFSKLNAMRHAFEPLDELTRPASARGLTNRRKAQIVRQSLDVRTLLTLLAGPRPFKYLIGHSKGNLVIAEALQALGEDAPDRLAERAEEIHAITLSARIPLPPAMRKVTNVMGALDGFGQLNSDHSIPSDIIVPMAGHHTNTEILYHLPVTQVVSDIVAAEEG